MGTATRLKRGRGIKARRFEHNGGVLGMKDYLPHG